MIPNQWYAVLEANEIKKGKPTAFKRLGRDLVFWRNLHGKVVVMEDRCPHRQVKLSLGKLVDGCIECPFHGFRYDSTGGCQLIPANGKNGPRPKVLRAETLVAQEKHGFIWLWNGEPQTEYPPIPFFEDELGPDFAYGGVKVDWPVHYTRAVENQLDVAHLPFVHASTIGKGNKTLVNGPYTTLENDMLSVWFNNQLDEGLPASRPTPPPAGQPWLIGFKFPNLWMLRIAENYKLVAAFAPIDEENTRLYVRTYMKTNLPQRFRNLAAQLSAYSNYLILGQDKRVVVSHNPKAGGLDSGDHYIPADRPILVYYQHREALIAAAEAEANQDEQDYAEPKAS